MMLKGKDVSWLALVGALAAAPLGTAAVAADTTTTPGATTPPAEATTTPAPERKGDDVTVVEPSAPPQAKGTLADLVPGQVTAEDLIGKSVVNADGKTIGEINDIVLDKDKAVYAVLSVGGFLGIGADYVAVPFEKIQLTTTEEGSREVRLVADVTADDLKALAKQQRGETTAAAGRATPAPAPSSDATGATGAPAEAPAVAPAPATGDQSTAATEPAPDEAAPAAGPDQQVAAADAEMTAEDLIGKSVVNENGETIGTIDDLVIDDQKVVIAVVSVGGFLGIASKDVAVPLEQLQVSQDKATFMSSLTKDDLEKMPAYEKGTLKDVERDKPLPGLSGG